MLPRLLAVYDPGCSLLFWGSGGVEKTHWSLACITTLLYMLFRPRVPILGGEILAVSEVVLETSLK